VVKEDLDRIKKKIDLQEGTPRGGKEGRQRPCRGGVWIPRSSRNLQSASLSWLPLWPGHGGGQREREREGEGGREGE
jgi:hypothetical protein